MTRKIIKRLFNTYNCVLLADNTSFAIDSEEAVITLTKNEIELLAKVQKDNTINYFTCHLIKFIQETLALLQRPNKTQSRWGLETLRPSHLIHSIQSPFTKGDD